MLFQRHLNKAKIAYWNSNKLQWNLAQNCHQKNGKEASYNCPTFSSYCVLFVSTLSLSQILYACTKLEVTRLYQWSFVNIVTINFFCIF